jgi:hypothetical protein
MKNKMIERNTQQTNKIKNRRSRDIAQLNRWELKICDSTEYPQRTTYLTEKKKIKVDMVSLSLNHLVSILETR